jgi:hypothetical protein
MRVISVVCVCIALVAGGAARAPADASIDASVRIGLDADVRGAAFALYEVVGWFAFAPFLRWHDNWSLGLSLIGSAGLLTDDASNGLIIGIGPRLGLKFPGGNWELYISSRASALTQHKFGGTDLGGWFMFSSDIGIQYLLKDRLILGYSFQHSSNARIYESNPGVDFHVLQIAWRF